MNDQFSPLFFLDYFISLFYPIICGVICRCSVLFFFFFKKRICIVLFRAAQSNCPG